MIKLKDIVKGKVYTDKDLKPFKLNEDGHTDVPSAIRKLKLSIEDSQQLIKKCLYQHGGQTKSHWLPII